MAEILDGHTIEHGGGWTLGSKEDKRRMDTGTGYGRKDEHRQQDVRLASVSPHAREGESLRRHRQR